MLEGFGLLARFNMYAFVHYETPDTGFCERPFTITVQILFPQFWCLPSSRPAIEPAHRARDRDIPPPRQRARTPTIAPRAPAPSFGANKVEATGCSTMLRFI